MAKKKQKKKSSWNKYFFEFISIFIGVTLAFALSNWNDDRRERRFERKVLQEIKTGLKLDAEDIAQNVKGHQSGLYSERVFRNLLLHQTEISDSAGGHFRSLLRDYISVQNKSGYETLKSKGFNLIQNDSLRLNILTLYDFHYEILEKLEENYSAMQFHRTYYDHFSRLLSPNMIFSDNGELQRITVPSHLDQTEVNLLLQSLQKIKSDRQMMVDFYGSTFEQLNKVRSLIKE